jgi:phytanoyl-CoA hydroxylase
MTHRLSPAQVQFFHDEGYLIVKDVFVPGELEPLRGELADRVNRKAQELFADGKLKDLHADEPFDRRLARICDDSPENARAIIKDLTGIAGGGHAGIEMFKVITHPGLLSVIESLTGEEIVASSVYRVRPKLPRYARGVVPWHQDSGYFAAHCDQHLIVTCWIPLVDANEHNGCMRIQPRAHKQGIATHHTGGHAGFLVIEDEDLPLPSENSICAECPLGGVVLMTNLTPHCSTENQSEDIRWSIDLRYQSASVPNNVDLMPDLDSLAQQPADLQIACYPPEADFVVRSKKQPATTFEEYRQRREAYDQAARQVGYPQRGWTPMVSR